MGRPQGADKGEDAFKRYLFRGASCGRGAAYAALRVGGQRCIHRWQRACVADVGECSLTKGIARVWFQGAGTQSAARYVVPCIMRAGEAGAGGPRGRRRRPSLGLGWAAAHGPAARSRGRGALTRGRPPPPCTGSGRSCGRSSQTLRGGGGGVGVLGGGVVGVLGCVLGVCVGLRAGAGSRGDAGARPGTERPARLALPPPTAAVLLPLPSPLPARRRAPPAPGLPARRARSPLSYHETSLTKVGDSWMPAPASTIDDSVLPTKSVLTTASVVKLQGGGRAGRMGGRAGQRLRAAPTAARAPDDASAPPSHSPLLAGWLAAVQQGATLRRTTRPPGAPPNGREGPQPRTPGCP